MKSRMAVLLAVVGCGWVLHGASLHADTLTPGDFSHSMQITFSGYSGSTLTNNTADTKVDLVVKGGNTDLIWTANTDSKWDIGITANWDDGNGNTMFADGDRVNFADSPASFDVEVAQDVTPSAMTVDNSTADYTFTGAAINGSFALIKKGTAKLTLANDNGYSGGTVISNGTVQVGNGGATGTLGSGAVTNDGALVFNRSAALTLSQTVSGTGSVTQAGSATLTVTSDNTYSGTTTVNGPLQIGNNGTTGSLGTGPLVINGKQLTINRSNALTMTNALSGSGTIYKLNGNTLTYSGTSTFAGTLQLAGGTFTLASGGSITNLYNVKIDQYKSATINLDAPFNSSSFHTVTTGGGTHSDTYIVRVNVNSEFKVGNFYGAYSGRNYGKSQTVLNINSGANAVIGTAEISWTGYCQATTAETYIKVNDGSTLTVTDLLGRISDSRTYGKHHNRYVYVYGTGRLNVKRVDFSQKGDSQSYYSRLLQLNGGTLANIAGNDMTVDATTPLNIVGSGTVEIGDGNVGTINGVVKGSGEFIKSGCGTLRLAGTNNTFTSDVTVNAGTLEIAQSWLGGTNAVLSISGGGKVSPDGGVNAVVKELWLDGTQFQSGTWGSSSSSAQYKNDRYFAGSGIVTVLEGEMPGFLFYLR